MSDPGWAIHSGIALAVTVATAALAWAANRWLGTSISVPLAAFIGAIVASAFFYLREWIQQMRGAFPPKPPTWLITQWGPKGKLEAGAPMAFTLSAAIAITAVL